MLLALAAAGVALLAAGVAVAGGALEEDAPPVVAASGHPTPVPGRPGWTFAAAISASGRPCIAVSSPLGRQRACAADATPPPMLGAGFMADERTGERYGWVTGFAAPGEALRAAFSDGSWRALTATPAGAYFLPVTPADIAASVVPERIDDASGTPLTPEIPRAAFLDGEDA
jgi:hypothetical protein